MTPKKVDELLKKGAALYAEGNTTAAARVYRDALKIAPDDPTVRLRHATAIWHGEDRASEALAELDALARDYPQAVIFATQSLILNSLGRFPDAATAARRALRADPEHSSAWLDLATATPGDEAATLIKELQSELQTRSNQPRVQRDMHHALARLLRKTGRLDEAFAHTTRGNDLQPQRWNLENEQTFRKQLREVFDAELMQSYALDATFGQEMIFIVGMPRSGTTLTERMLIAHPQIGSIGESKSIGNLYMQLRQACTRRATAVQDSLNPTMLRQIGQAVLQAAKVRVRGHPKRIVDKMPANTMFVPFIRLILPGATIVHLSRHPLDTCLSCYEASFAFGLDYATRQESLADAYRMNAELMDHWATLPGIDIQDVSYEDLVTDPEPAMRPVLAKVGVPWDAACLTPASDGAIKTASVGQAREVAHTGSIGRWVPHKDRLQPLIERLGGMDWITSRMNTTKG